MLKDRKYTGAYWPFPLLRWVHKIIGPKLSSQLIEETHFLEKQKHAYRLINSPVKSHSKLTQNVLDLRIKIDQPLVLVSQIQRTGGSLLAQLFDSHPELHAHPHELKIGYPYKGIWADLDNTDDPKEWFRFLFEDMIPKFYTRGYEKKGLKEEDSVKHPFYLAPDIQRAIFLEEIKDIASPSYRQKLDAYMTSYFNGWLNYGNRAGQKKYITGFTPELADSHDNVRRFFDIYPDGKLISIVRDPYRWYASATRLKPEVFRLDAGIHLWKSSCEAMLQNKKAFNDRVLLLRFEDLILNLPETMRTVADFIGIEFDKTLLVPTFNGLPMKANSSFAVEDKGITTQPATREVNLPDNEMAYIKKECSGIYDSVLKQVATVD